MANFCYKAIAANGKNVRGVVEADNERQAVAAVRDKGLVPLSVESAAAVVSASGTPADSRFSLKRLLAALHPVPKTAVAAMARQLATLLHAGLPLDEALGSICAHDDMSRMQGIVARLRERIMAGGDLADGLAEFPHVFSSTFVTMVRAGEASGTLELVIERFAEHIEQQVALVRKVQATLAYPVLMLFVGLGVVIFLLTFVIPKVTQIFSDMGRALPVPTQILLAVSDGIRAWWWVLALALAFALIACWRMGKTPKGRRRAHRLLLRFPGISGVYRPLIVGHMARTLGMLLKNGVTLLKALHIVRSVADNTLMVEAVQNMIDGVQAGRDSSEFMGNPLVPAAGSANGRRRRTQRPAREMLLWV
ncbi:MAG: type II secretion system F family protein, partial [Bilophila sp.]